MLHKLNIHCYLILTDAILQLELALKREFGDMLKALVDEVPSFTFSSITIVWKLIPYFDNSCLVSQNVCLKVSKHLLTWAEEQTYWIAARFLMLGFKLELYSPNEYCMVYWYLYIILMRLLDKMQVRLSNRGDCKNLNFILVFLG